MRAPLSALCFAFAVAATPLAAQEHGHSAAVSPYAGFEARPIKSLSETDIEQLRRGEGWGLALPAELNGFPGPTHLLDLKDEIGLSPEQVAGIEAIYAAMKAEAVTAGATFIAAEAAIEAGFADRQIDAAGLRELIDAAAAARAELRFIHLSRHLMMPPLLSDAQIRRYGELRGYTAAANPCAGVPTGHDPAVWREHNGCD